MEAKGTAMTNPRKIQTGKARIEIAMPMFLNPIDECLFMPGIGKCLV